MDDTTRSYSARWVFPVTGPPLRNGIVIVCGSRITSVEPAGTVTADFNLGNVAILPGFVNAHTHLDLSGARDLTPPTDFVAWLKSVIAFRRNRTHEQVLSDIQSGIEECLHFGTVLVGDIASQGLSWNSLATSPLSSVVFHELIGLSDERWQQAENTYAQWANAHPDTINCHKGVSPHAPYSVHRKAFSLARSASEGIYSVHIAESLPELELLEHRTGPLVDFLTGLGVYHPDNLATLEEILVGMKDQHCLWIHANYLPESLWHYIGNNQTVVICPRTHAAFGHSPHPYRRTLERGIRVAIGTDSLASNPDLDVLAEARCLYTQDPSLPGETLLRMMTLSGAEALGFDGEYGSLEPAKSAKIVAVTLPDRGDDPYRLLFDPREATSTRFIS